MKIASAVAVVPVFRVEKLFQNGTRQVFHQCGNEYAGCIKQNQMILERHQRDGNKNTACSINRAEWAVQKSAIDKFMFWNRTDNALRQPTDKAVNGKQKKQNPNILHSTPPFVKVEISLIRQKAMVEWL